MLQLSLQICTEMFVPKMLMQIRGRALRTLGDTLAPKADTPAAVELSWLVVSPLLGCLVPFPTLKWSNTMLQRFTSCPTYLLQLVATQKSVDSMYCRRC